MTVMNRVMVSCGDSPNDISCSVSISGPEEQVLELAIEHAVKKHGHQRDDALIAHLREQLRAAPAGL